MKWSSTQTANCSVDDKKKLFPKGRRDSKQLGCIVFGNNMLPHGVSKSNTLVLES